MVHPVLELLQGPPDTKQWWMQADSYKSHGVAIPPFLAMLEFPVLMECPRCSGGDCRCYLMAHLHCGIPVQSWWPTTATSGSLPLQTAAICHHYSGYRCGQWCLSLGDIHQLLATWSLLCIHMLQGGGLWLLMAEAYQWGSIAYVTEGSWPPVGDRQVTHLSWELYWWIPTSFMLVSTEDVPAYYQDQGLLLSGRVVPSSWALQQLLRHLLP